MDIAVIIAEEERVVGVMRGRPPMRAMEIARLADMERSRASRALRRLERRGCASRVLLVAGSGTARWTLGTAAPDGWRRVL